MIIESIKNGSVRVSMDAEECAALAQVCDDSDGDPRAYLLVMTMGTALRVAAVIGLAQGDMHVPELERLDKILQAHGLAA